MNTLHGSKMPLLTALARPFLILQDALSVGEDCWTWRTIQDEVYEEVALLRLNRHTVTIRHKFGDTTIARTDLLPEIQNSLIDSSEMSQPDETYVADEQEHFLGSMPMAHAK